MAAIKGLATVVGAAGRSWAAIGAVRALSSSGGGAVGRGRGALFAGSFDPVTSGHMDIIKRASTVFPKVFVGVGINPAKRGIFDYDERVRLIEESCAAEGVDNVSVVTFQGLLVTYAMENKEVGVLVRGIRAFSDFEQEFRMALVNRQLTNDELDTVFFMSDEALSHVSSTLVKEVAYFGSRLQRAVPDAIADEVYARLPRREENE